MIYQKHPNHGLHIAYSANEEQDNISHGWVTVSEEEFYGVKKEVKEDLKFSRKELIELHELKFGKKPHHKLSDKKIQAKLDE